MLIRVIRIAIILSDFALDFNAVFRYNRKAYKEACRIAESNQQASNHMSNTAVADAKTMQELLTLEGVEIKVPKEGDVLEGRVISAGKNEVYVDIDGVGLGVVRGRELYYEYVRTG
jgi:exosome complex RNA-binding protein Csl4